MPNLIKNYILFNFFIHFRLAPLYEIVTSGDTTYSKATVLLENLKNTLIDVNDLRHEPLVLKIQSNYQLFFFLSFNIKIMILKYSILR